MVGVDAGGDVLLRLTELGLRRGAPVRVVQHAGLGGRLIALGCGRIALDSGTARRIEVAEEAAS